MKAIFIGFCHYYKSNESRQFETRSIQNKNWVKVFNKWCLTNARVQCQKTFLGASSTV